MSSLFNTIGQSNPDFLLADPQGATLIAVPMEPMNGVVPRGTIVYRKPSGMYAPATAAEAVATNNLVVLNEEVDTAANETIAESAAAYRTGRLLADKVMLGDEGKLTAAIALALRQQGIVLDPFDNWADEENVFENTTD